MMTVTTFAGQVLGQVPAGAPVFPQASYDPDGDCIEFIISPESFYAKRIDRLTTVYIGQDSGQIVGSLIKGVRNFIANVLKTAPGFRVEILDGRIRLRHLFSAKLWSEQVASGPDEIYIYQFLRQKAEETNAEVLLPTGTGELELS